MNIQHRLDKTIGSPMRISAAETARRRDAVDFARRNVRYEGFTLSDEAEAISRRYIAGEITSEEHVAAIKALG